MKTEKIQVIISVILTIAVVIIILHLPDPFHNIELSDEDNLFMIEAKNPCEKHYIYDGIEFTSEHDVYYLTSWKEYLKYEVTDFCDILIYKFDEEMSDGDSRFNYRWRINATKEEMINSTKPNYHYIALLCHMIDHECEI